VIKATASKQVTSDSIIEVIRQEFAELLHQTELDATTRLTQEFGLDSMDIVRLQVALEDYYDIRFDPETTDFDVVFSTPTTLAKHIKLETER